MVVSSGVRSVSHARAQWVTTWAGQDSVHLSSFAAFPWDLRVNSENNCHEAVRRDSKFLNWLGGSGCEINSCIPLFPFFHLQIHSLYHNQNCLKCKSDYLTLLFKSPAGAPCCIRPLMLSTGLFRTWPWFPCLTSRQYPPLTFQPWAARVPIVLVSSLSVFALSVPSAAVPFPYFVFPKNAYLVFQTKFRHPLLHIPWPPQAELNIPPLGASQFLLFYMLLDQGAFTGDMLSSTKLLGPWYRSCGCHYWFPE